MRANVGDELTVRGRQQGMEDRHGLIIEVHGKDGTPPYLVRWRDDKESIFFPSADTVVEHHPAEAQGPRDKTDPPPRRQHQRRFDEA